MSDSTGNAQELQKEIGQTIKQLHIDELVSRKQALDEEARQSDFWQNNQHAQEVTREQAKLEGRTRPWLELERDIHELVELTELEDPSIEAELKRQVESITERFMSAKEELKFIGPFDDHDAIVSIHAGAGGTDAQDWTQMLLRMYVRWAEGQGYTIKTIDESGGEEAGIKSVTLEILGAFVYGKLKGEHGVHRLVRLSPFNSDNLRQTSFAKVEVSPKIDRPEEVAIDDKDIKIDVYRSGGHGGQSVNTTDSAVRVTHLPTGIVVAIQNERSQLQNKETALTILRSRLAQLQLEQHAEKLEQIKGPNEQAAWGNQIRSYVLHPYKQVKDLRTRHETSDPQAVLDGKLDPFIDAYLDYSLGK